MLIVRRGHQPLAFAGVQHHLGVQRDAHGPAREGVHLYLGAADILVGALIGTARAAEGAAALLHVIRAGAAGILEGDDELRVELGQRIDGVHRLHGGQLLGERHQGVFPDAHGDVLPGLDVAQFHRLGGDDNLSLCFHVDFPPHSD